MEQGKPLAEAMIETLGAADSMNGMLKKVDALMVE